jgi:hypothetical protein
VRGVDEFMRQLAGLGYSPTMPEPGFVAFAYVIEVGPLAGEEIELGMRPSENLTVAPPGGILVRPHLLPLNPDASQGHPYGAVHPASTGAVADASWQYWSRPHPNWAATDRSVRAYLHGHVRALFARLPNALQRGPHN